MAGHRERNKKAKIVVAPKMEVIAPKKEVKLKSKKPKKVKKED